MEVITFSKVSKVIGKRIILKDVSFKVEKGSIFGLLGPNGAGKTTIIRIILGLFEPTSGKVEILGKEIGKTKEKIGFILHKTGLYPKLSCIENILLYADIYKVHDRSKIEFLLKEVGLWERKDDKVEIFSRGMQQKLALARALIHNPDLLILDEPTVGLDIETKIWFREYIKKLREEGKTILLSSHELTEVEKLCTHIGIIREGNLLEYGKVEDLKEKYKKYSLEDIYLYLKDEIYLERV
ncbi:ABC transporter ATP-binding protein [Dictyoglomus thermophilum]|jgi:ABC-2 type transport system ATP-binding protein|uniref:ABC transporter, ATP-binding protein n=1 Tax=Dictyoglomus thermophilum (strain ATCC 35947 / DSM 3960 / H-6-12) TaxID=309799 RepID=B5YBB1_DICT6|nr:ABC transporter ATP-binding protein [Dictyoglomus thermophilum]ACI19188.1 ABC transporter, ATP-binding protein [Dictyoglomus thermophilum H-6-12]